MKNGVTGDGVSERAHALRDAGQALAEPGFSSVSRCYLMKKLMKKPRRCRRG
jgi:hypothetical protein